MCYFLKKKNIFYHLYLNLIYQKWKQNKIKFLWIFSTYNREFWLCFIIKCKKISMIFINNEMMFFLMKWHFLKYKYQQIVRCSIKIIVNLMIFEVEVSVYLNLWITNV